MKLDPRFVKLVYKISDTDPTITENQSSKDIPEGALWVNEITGKVFIAIKHPNNPAKIVWLAISDTAEDILSQFSFPTYNIVDIFNDNSIVAFYPFDGNAQDLANGYNGTWHGNEQYDEGIFGRAAKFTGNNWIEIGTNLAQENLINNEFSISIWVKPSVSQQSYDKSSYVGIIHFAQCGSCGCCGTGIGISRSNPQTLNISIADSPCGSGFGKSFADVLKLDKWQHIVLTSKGLYLNGNLVELWTSKTFGNRVDGIAIGATYKDCYASPPPPFIGFIDQLRIYKRALSTDEIQTLYREMLWTIK